MIIHHSSYIVRKEKKTNKLIYLLLGSVVLFLAYSVIGTNRNSKHNQVIEIKIKDNNLNKSINEINTKKQLEFYNILPKQEIYIPSQELIDNNKIRYNYNVQIASFKNLKDANKLKEFLIEKGLKTKVVIIKDKKNNVWHRIQSGPYGARSVEKIRRTLSSLNLNVKPFIIKTLLQKKP